VDGRDKPGHAPIFVITGRQHPASNASGKALPDPVIHEKAQRAQTFRMDRRVSFRQSALRAGRNGPVMTKGGVRP
jgi:hypothetical protein